MAPTVARTILCLVRQRHGLLAALDHQGSITAIANIDGNLLWLNAYERNRAGGPPPGREIVSGRI
jgi:hypothetical protein